MHGLPYINKVNFERANQQAEHIIKQQKAAGVPEKKAAEFEADIKEATERLTFVGTQTNKDSAPGIIPVVWDEV